MRLPRTATSRVPSGNCEANTCFFSFGDKIGRSHQQMNSSQSGLIRLIADFKVLKTACLVVWALAS